MAVKYRRWVVDSGGGCQRWIVNGVGVVRCVWVLMMEVVRYGGWQWWLLEVSGQRWKIMVGGRGIIVLGRVIGGDGGSQRWVIGGVGDA